MLLIVSQSSCVFNFQFLDEGAWAKNRERLQSPGIKSVTKAMCLCASMRQLAWVDTKTRTDSQLCWSWIGVSSSFCIKFEGINTYGSTQDSPVTLGGWHPVAMWRVRKIGGSWGLGWWAWWLMLVEALGWSWWKGRWWWLTSIWAWFFVCRVICMYFKAR